MARLTALLAEVDEIGQAVEQPRGHPQWGGDQSRGLADPPEPLAVALDSSSASPLLGWFGASMLSPLLGWLGAQALRDRVGIGLVRGSSLGVRVFRRTGLVARRHLGPLFALDAGRSLLHLGERFEVVGVQLGAAAAVEFGLLGS